MYIAHKNEILGKEQSVKEHSENTAELCKKFAVSDWKSIAYATGLLHDVGKYQKSFARRIAGENIRVEHSICGAQAALDHYGENKFFAWMMAYCIAGHHTGLPDGGSPGDSDEMTTLQGRRKRSMEDFGAYKKELTLPEVDEARIASLLTEGLNHEERGAQLLLDRIAFFVRYLFSCLVDADSRDTAEACGEKELPRLLNADFEACLERVNQRMETFHCETELQKMRNVLQKQAVDNSRKKAEVYLLNMPTGSGKTLLSVKIALEHLLAEKGRKKRIIYVIPYNSIIDQTAQVFQDLFGDQVEILRHQSTFSYEESSEDYQEITKHATENWEAPFIITTAVQFFESIYSNRRGKLRKLHNMADSVLIFDEAHMMPVDYFQACMQAVAYISHYLNSESILLTATMPDYEKMIKTYALKNIRVENLITDHTPFKAFKKCRYTNLGKISWENLLLKARQYPSSLIIVNKRISAKKLYKMNENRGKTYHLSTYMTAVDRKRVLAEIKEDLTNLERDFPNLEHVPEERRILIVSTSLIEAGVDLDVYTVFRELAGLGSILQAGGRCNREGKRSEADVYIFGDEESSTTEEGEFTKGLLEKYPDIYEEACIREYYDWLFFNNKEKKERKSIHENCSDASNIPFRKYADEFELIQSNTLSLVVARDDVSKKLVEDLERGAWVDVRQLQKYTCSLYRQEMDDLEKQHVLGMCGGDIYYLKNPDYYDENLGILFEASDCFV